LNHFNAIHCIVGIRGGGEKGEFWHDSGRKENRTNGFKDVITFAELIQKKGMTTP
jgi:prolyl oligopeptidase